MGNSVIYIKILISINAEFSIICTHEKVINTLGVLITFSSFSLLRAVSRPLPSSAVLCRSLTSVSPFSKGVWGFRSLLVQTGKKTCENLLTEVEKYDIFLL